MKQKIALFLILCLTSCSVTFAQAQRQKMDEDEKAEKRDARTNRINDKNDYAIFRRQMLSLKEYTAERNKIPNLQKANKMPVKVSVVVDTTIDIDDEAGKKSLVGYIKQDIGDNSSNVYEVTFDRAQKKIVNVKFTGEASDVEKEEKTTAPKKAAPGKTVHKKNKDDDDDDEPEDEKPSKKDKDDDKD